MKGLLRLALFVGAAAGIGYLYQHGAFQGAIQRFASPQTGGAQGFAHSARSPETLRLASFNIQDFGAAKLKRPEIAQILAEVTRRFDIIALQEIRSLDANLIPMFLDLVNSTGRHYEFAAGPQVGASEQAEQYAFLFDTERVEIDRLALYTLDDPDNLLLRDPLVATFRAIGPQATEAFTFTLVNLHVDSRQADAEINVLDDVLQAVRNDGRGEDDVILLGTLNTDDRHLGELGQSQSVLCALSQVPTNTRGTRMYDNVVFDRMATREFEGRAGVVDLLAEFNLTMEQALEVSDHLPIWADFSIFEGGRSGPLASRPTVTP